MYIRIAILNACTFFQILTSTHKIEKHYNTPIIPLIRQQEHEFHKLLLWRLVLCVFLPSANPRSMPAVESLESVIRIFFTYKRILTTVLPFKWLRFPSELLNSGHYK